MNIKRREFLAQSARGLGGILLGAPLLARAEVPVKYFDPFARVPIGRT